MLGVMREASLLLHSALFPRVREKCRISGSFSDLVRPKSALPSSELGHLWCLGDISVPVSATWAPDVNAIVQPFNEILLPSVNGTYSCDKRFPTCEFMESYTKEEKKNHISFLSFTLIRHSGIASSLLHTHQTPERLWLLWTVATESESPGLSPSLTSPGAGLRNLNAYQAHQVILIYSKE